MPTAAIARTALSYAAVLDQYVGALEAAPLAEQTRRTYASKLRQYLAWLAVAEVDGDPIASTAGRDWAVRDYRTHLQAVLKRKPATVLIVARADKRTRGGVVAAAAFGVADARASILRNFLRATVTASPAAFLRPLSGGRFGERIRAGGDSDEFWRLLRSDRHR
jgi:hypothetical protein